MRTANLFFDLSQYRYQSVFCRTEAATVGPASVVVAVKSAACSESGTVTKRLFGCTTCFLRNQQTESSAISAAFSESDTVTNRVFGWSARSQEESAIGFL